MFLHINHSQDQIIAMRYLTKGILESKVKALSESVTSETEQDIKKKISKYELFIKKTKDIDNNDFMVFDYLKYAIGENQYFQSIFINNKKYVWITRSKFISDLPTLNIKSENNVTGRLSKYIDMGILEKHTIRGKVSKVYFSFTDLASKILGKTLEDREFVRDILVKNGFINKNKSPQKTIAENPQPPKQPTEQREKPKQTIKQKKQDEVKRFITYVIENTKKLYPSVDVELFTEYLKEKKGKKNQRAGQIILKKIKDCVDGGHDVNSVIERAYEGNYQSLFVPTFNATRANSSTKPKLKPLAIEYINGRIEEYETGKDITWIVEKNGMANLESRYHVVGKPKLNEELKRRGLI